MCLILRACAESKVRELKFAGLHVSFGKPTEETPAPALPPMGNPATPVELTSPVQSAAEIATEQTKQNDKSLAQAEIEAKDMQLALLAIEDPMEFERQLMNGELTDESTAGDDDEEA